VLVAFLIVGPIYGRAILESRASLSAAEVLRTEDIAAATVSYRHALEWYAPGNPYSRRAADALWEIAQSADDTPQGRAQALLALDSLRTGILVTRHLLTPYGDRIEPVERRIAELRGADEAGVARQHALLVSSRERAPGTVWSLVTAVAFVLWIVFTLVGIQRVFGAEAAHRRRPLATFGAASAVCLATWIVGLQLV
jgi:hypothetical protein